MKKVLLKTITSAIIIASLPIDLVPALAATVTPESQPTGGQGTTPITATVSDSYTLTIPDSYTFGTIYKTQAQYYKFSNEGTGSVHLDDVLLTAGNAITVKVGDAADDYTLKEQNTPTNTVTFNMYKAKSADGSVTTAFTKGEEIISKATAPTTATPNDCFAGIDVNTITNAGSYRGGIIFRVSVVTA